jgi:hypothetical protein
LGLLNYKQNEGQHAQTYVKGEMETYLFSFQVSICSIKLEKDAEVCCFLGILLWYMKTYYKVGGWWASPVRSVAAAVVEGGGGRGCWPCWGREKRMKKREEKILGGKNKLYTL